MSALTLLLQWLEEKQPIPFTSLILIIFTVFILFRFSRGAWSKKLNLPPSPPKLPLIGNLHQRGTLVHRSLRDLSDKYGPLMLLHFGGAPALVVSSAEMAREFLKTHDLAFGSRPFATAPNKLFYGCTDVAFSPYGEYWRQLRKISVIELLSAKRIQSYKFVREEEVALMIEKIRSTSLGKNSINLTDLAVCLSNNIICRCTLGRKHEAKDGENNFGELVREFMHLFGAFSFGDLYPWLGWVDRLTGLLGRMERVSGEIYAFIDKIINEHVIDQKNYGSDHKMDFVDLLLQVQQENRHEIKLSRENIKAILMDMFIGGTDTSMTTIEWGISELLKHPNAMKKAQEEVRRVAGMKSKVDEDDIYLMDYLKAVVKETLRLHPPEPLLVPRESTIGTNVKGYDIPAKTKVMVNAWAIQRDPKTWDRAEEFVPERFIDNPIDFKGQYFEYIPFGSGRRSCPGMSFAMAVTELSIANLLYWFDWGLPGGASSDELDMTEAFGLSVAKKYPLHLVAKSHFS